MGWLGCGSWSGPRVRRAGGARKGMDRAGVGFHAPMAWSLFLPLGCPGREMPSREPSTDAPARGRGSAWLRRHSAPRSLPMRSRACAGPTVDPLPVSSLPRRALRRWPDESEHRQDKGAGKVWDKDWQFFWGPSVMAGQSQGHALASSCSDGDRRSPVEPAIHANTGLVAFAWIPATRAGMTVEVRAFRRRRTRIHSCTAPSVMAGLEPDIHASTTLALAWHRPLRHDRP